MTTIPEQCVYLCGPYLGYCGRAEYDAAERMFHGEVVGTNDVVTFQGKTMAVARKAFRQSVDDYLAFCQKLGQQPQRPYSGKFVARLDPELHKQASLLAQAAGVSLNQFVANCLAVTVKSGISPPSPPAQRKGQGKKSGLSGSRITKVSRAGKRRGKRAL